MLKYRAARPTTPNMMYRKMSTRYSHDRPLRFNSCMHTHQPWTAVLPVTLSRVGMQQEHGASAMQRVSMLFALDNNADADAAEYE